MILTLSENGFDEDYLSDVPVRHFADELTIEECMVVAVEESDKAWNQIMQGIALSEIRELAESGEVMIYEEGKISGIIESFKKWVSGVWARITGLFEKFMKWVREKLSGDKRFIKKYKEKILKATVPADGLNIGGKWYTFAGLKSAVKNAQNIGFSGPAAIDSMTEEKKDTLVKGIYSACVDGATKSDFKEKFKKVLIGEEKTGNIPASQINKPEVVEDIEKSQETMNAARTTYKGVKNTLNKAISSAKKTKKDNKEDGYAKKVSLYVSYLKEVIKLESDICSGIISALKMYNKQNKAIGRKLAKAAAEKKESGAKNESYQFDDNLDDFFSTSFC